MTSGNSGGVISEVARSSNLAEIRQEVGDRQRSRIARWKSDLMAQGLLPEERELDSTLDVSEPSPCVSRRLHSLFQSDVSRRISGWICRSRSHSVLLLLSQFTGVDVWASPGTPLHGHTRLCAQCYVTEPWHKLTWQLANQPYCQVHQRHLLWNVLGVVIHSDCRVIGQQGSVIAAYSSLI